MKLKAGSWEERGHGCPGAGLAGRQLQPVVPTHLAAANASPNPATALSSYINLL